MDRLTTVMVRLSLGWLLAGFIIGGLMLVDRIVPGDWRAWLTPSHGHMLFVGWFFQFVIGIAFWLLPRKRSPERPLGYHERFSLLAVVMLNIGLLLRVAGEPLERIGQGGLVTISSLSASATLQMVAALIFVAQLWPRTGVRQIRKRQREES